MRVLVVYQHLAHYRHGVFLALQESDRHVYEFAADTSSRRDAVPTMDATSLRAFRKLKNLWIGPFLWQRGLMRLLVTGRYDAVIFLGDFSYLSTWVGAALSRLIGSHTFFWTIGWHQKDEGLRKLVRLAFYRLADELLLYGNVGRRIGESLGYPPHRMTVIGNSHSSDLEGRTSARPERLEQLRGQLADCQKNVVGAVIRLNPEKRLDLLVQAAAHLERTGTAVTVVLAGVGPEGENLRSTADRLGVDLRMLGACYAKAELDVVYEYLDVTVVPVYAGLTSIQSLKYGKPVITSDNGFNQAPESECIRPGVTGAFYADGSVPGLAETMAEVLNRVHSDRLRVEDQCRSEIAERWSVTAHATAIERAVDSSVAPARWPSLRLH